MRRVARAVSLSLGGILVGSLCLGYVSAAPKFSAWSAPTNLAALNTAFDEAGPAISKDGRSLYFHSNRPGGQGLSDLYVSERESADDPWGPPQNLGAVVNTAFTESVPNFSRDGHYLFFASDRPGGAGNLDMWVSWREHTHDNFGWQAAVPLAALNTASIDAGPGYFENDGAGAPQLFFASDRPGGPGALDIFVSEQDADGAFGPPVRIDELASPLADQAPEVSHDGLVMYLQSGRTGTSGPADLWMSTRAAVGDPWSTPTNLGPVVNSAFIEGQPSISNDRRTLFFFSNRTGGAGANDLWVTTRAK